MKTKFNPQLLQEELKKFKTLSEWAFYEERNDDDNNLLYSNDDKILEADDEEGGSSADELAGDLGVDAPDDAPDDAGGDTPPDAPIDEPAPDAPADGAPAEAPPTDPVTTPPPAPMPEPADDEVEVDITDLMHDSKRTKQTSFMANQHTKMLLQKFQELEARVSQMDKVTQQIEDLEQELIKRNPTPVENLEMQTIHSAPYTQKLSDYWADKEGPYDVMHNNTKKKEYILDKDAIESDYSDANIKNSFGAISDENEYEEEDY